MKRIALFTTTLVACGEVTPRGVPDAPGDDASVDANPRGTVKVTVYDPDGRLTPNPGVQVVFVEPDGAIASRSASDLDGKVEAQVLPGSSVTAVWLTGASQYQVQTVFGVKGGDDLVMAGNRSDSTAVGEFTVSWPAMAGASYYNVFSSCGARYAPATSLTLTIANYCRRDPMTVAVMAYDANGTPIGYLEKPEVAFSPGGSTVLAGTYASLGAFEATFTNLDPATTSYVDVRRWSRQNGYSGYAGGSIVAPTLTVATQVSVSATAYVQTTVQRPNLGYQSVYQRTNGASLSYTLNLANNLIAWLSPPVFDPATGALTVMSTSSGPVDGATAGVQYEHATAFINWIVVAADFTAPLVFPPLPSEVGDLRPLAGDLVYPGSAVIFESAAIPGYDAVRNDVFGPLKRVEEFLGDDILRVSESYLD